VLARLTRLIRRGPTPSGGSRAGPTISQAASRPAFDTVFSFLVHANAAAWMASPFCRGVRFLQSIQTAQPDPGWHWRVQEFAATAAERVVVPSSSVADVAGRWAGIAREKLVVIPNAVDAGSFSRSPLPAEDPRPYPIVFLGRLDPVKRVPDLLEAVRLLDGLVHLHVYGEGRDRRRIVETVARLKLDSRVTLHGAVSAAAEALRTAGLLVLPSQAEGFGLVLIEAMAAGVPVVATDVAGIRDVVSNDRTGLLVPPGDPPALAGAIRRVLEDRSLRDSLVREGIRHVRERFSWEGVLPRYRALLGIARDGNEK
jgi:glycosyltransferase involved in cell wall biosynthesis